MKSTTGKKKDLQKPAGSNADEQMINTPDSSASTDEKDDDLPEEHLKGLDEALKGADRGEPVTLKEFKKMAKKWSTKEDQK